MLDQEFNAWLAGTTAGGAEGQLRTVHQRHGVPNQVLIHRDAAAVARAFAPSGAVEGNEEEGRAAAIEKGLLFFCKCVPCFPPLGCCWPSLWLTAPNFVSPSSLTSQPTHHSYTCPPS